MVKSCSPPHPIFFKLNSLVLSLMPQNIVKGASGAASIAFKRMVKAIPVTNKN